MVPPPSQSKQLGPYVTEHEPVALAHAETRDPSVVLLFGWMGARADQLNNCLVSLQECFPCSRILVIKADIPSSVFWFQSPQLEPLLLPVAKVIKREMQKSTRFRGVLLHILCLGGGFQLLKLHKALNSLSISLSDDSAPTALVLDSVPGGEASVQQGLAIIMPTNPMLRVVALPPCLALVVLIMGINRLAGFVPPLMELRKILNSPNLLPPITSAAASESMPRLYVYSHGDRTVEAKDVSSHAKDARAKGFEVHELVFSNTAHLGHLRRLRTSESEQYWDSVVDLWNRAIEKKSKPKARL